MNVEEQERVNQDIRRAASSFADLCSEEVSRRGEAQPCEKPAVALRYDPEVGMPYPVCPFHCRGDMVMLPALAAALTGPKETRE